MKSIKLAMILLVGQCVFNPLSALSKPLEKNTQTTVSVSNKVNCYAEEVAGHYFRDGINKLCDRAGYKRQLDYSRVNEDLREPTVGLINIVRRRRESCLKLQDTKGITDTNVIIDNCFKGIVTKNGYTEVDVIKACSNLIDLKGTTDLEAIMGCAEVGVDVNAAYLN